MMKFNDAQISILKQGLWALIANEEDWLEDDRQSVVDSARRNILQHGLFLLYLAKLFSSPGYAVFCKS